MIAEIRKVITPYYDKTKKKLSFKSRPALILKEINGDYTVLPISTISDKRRVDSYYDIPIPTSVYTKLNLNKDSYARTNKQTVVNGSEIGGKISDLKAEYPALFSEILNKVKEHNDLMISELTNLL